MVKFRVVFEAEASGGSKAGGLPHPSLFPFPPLPLSILPKFSGKPVGVKVRSSEGGVPRLPPTNTTQVKLSGNWQQGEGRAKVGRLLHWALNLAAQCIVIGPVCLQRAGVVCLCVSVSVTTITRNRVHRSSPNWVCR